MLHHRAMSRSSNDAADDNAVVDTHALESNGNNGREDARNDRRPAAVRNRRLRNSGTKGGSLLSSLVASIGGGGDRRRRSVPLLVISILLIGIGFGLGLGLVVFLALTTKTSMTTPSTNASPWSVLSSFFFGGRKGTATNLHPITSIPRISFPPPFPKILRPESTTTTTTNNSNNRHKNNFNTKSTMDSNGSTNHKSAVVAALLHQQQQQQQPQLLLSTNALDMCTQTLWHTIETTTIVLPHDETFIHTGDIDDLWLRDSAAQIHPLLLPLFGGGPPNYNYDTALVTLDPQLNRIVAGLIRRTALYIRHDPYANAFRIDDTYVFSPAQKKLGRHDLISTWNYELDSACYYIRMIYYYWQAQKQEYYHLMKTTTPDKAHQLLQDSVVRLSSVQDAIDIMITLWKAEQHHEWDEYPRGPFLDCVNCNKPYRYPGLQRNGKGSPTNATSGLTWTGFRPSDDECQYHFHIPSNMFAVTVLEYVIEMASTDYDLLGWTNGRDLAQRAHDLAHSIRVGIETHGTVQHPVHGRIYAYEVDGFGHALLMDDANVPSLLSIPYLGYRHYNAETYANTRRFIWSTDNPTYHEGTNPITGPWAGYGSPHMKAAIASNIWPMSLAVYGLVRLAYSFRGVTLICCYLRKEWLCILVPWNSLVGLVCFLVIFAVGKTHTTLVSHKTNQRILFDS
jgi:uncharacterized protein